MNKIIKHNETTFESIKRIDENGFEYWLARELMLALEYKRWDKFNNVINNAKIACKKSNYIIEEHFSQAGKMIELAKGAKRTILDYKLSRYACYLVVQNADPKKEVVALGQTYFAIQTRNNRTRIWFVIRWWKKILSKKINKSISRSILDELIKKELNITDITRLELENKVKYIYIDKDKNVKIDFK